ncbi:hypothetical protein ACGFYU_23260 [Streptomyces sp. NPDC048337]|uniref:hypothetical protein n=1 Tax=Streptomyces sp. NPDC048337 TaxID=3365535 RepID=UPI003714C23F
MSARIFGRRLRRGGAAALVSALVVAAVTASQGPAAGRTDPIAAAGGVVRSPFRGPEAAATPPTSPNCRPW